MQMHHYSCVHNWVSSGQCISIHNLVIQLIPGTVCGQSCRPYFREDFNLVLLYLWTFAALLLIFGCECVAPGVGEWFVGWVGWGVVSKNCLMLLACLMTSCLRARCSLSKGCVDLMLWLQDLIDAENIWNLSLKTGCSRSFLPFKKHIPFLMANLYMPGCCCCCCCWWWCRGWCCSRWKYIA